MRRERRTANHDEIADNARDECDDRSCLIRVLHKRKLKNPLQIDNWIKAES
jgi:hypothetical protein